MMMKTMYQSTSKLLSRKFSLLLILLCIFGIKESRASHATGADLTFRSLDSTHYVVTFTFYRDCSGIPVDPTYPLNLNSSTCGFDTNYTLYSFGTPIEVTPTCSTASTTCTGGTNIGIQQYTYSDTVTLPFACPDWNFNVSVSSRNQAVTTMQNPGSQSLYVDANLNNLNGPDNSPVFSIPPIAFECIGQTNVFNQGVTDADGDSLVYSFIAPRQDANTPLPYATGYSISQPFHSTPPVSIDLHSGDILLTPTQADVAIVAIEVLEYRNGVIIGSVMRDMQIYIVNCTNSLPVISGINGTPSHATSTCSGQLCFDINSTDPDQNQLLTMTWNHGIPAGTFTTTIGANGFPIGHFCWTPTAADARVNPYVFVVTLRDNACPSNGVVTQSFSVTVSTLSVSLTSTPSVQCNGSHNGSAAAHAVGVGLTYTWQLPNGTTIMGSQSALSHLGGGNYTLNVTDAGGCVGTQFFTIAEPAPIVVSTTPTSVGCGGSGTQGSILAAVTGGNGGNQYHWSNGSTTNPVNVPTGTYTVTVTDSHSCTGTGSASVVAVAHVNFSIATHGATCLANDGSATVSHVGGTGPFSYAWTPDVPGNTTTPALTGLLAGIYNVVATDLSSGCSQSLVGNVANLSGLAATISGSTDATCETGEDGSATVVATGGTPPYTYLWPNGDTTASTNHLAPGQVTVMVTDYLGCHAYAVVNIGFVNPAPAISLGPDTMPCIGTPYTMDAGSGFSSYLWSDNSTNQTLTVTTSGTYSVLVTNSNGCQNSDNINVNFVTCFSHGNTSTQAFKYNPILTVFPNPANNELNISISRIHNSEIALTLSDILGNTLYTSKESSEFNYTRKVDIHTLPAGIYTMRVEYNGEVKTLKVIKQ